ncbi:hypothetical protein [Legionella sp.]|uniref:hypothetical protein n=1 Tax=Legionella sp. TaxID=459 RepID=UPI000CC21BBC|nr:hypothetical protein [Legionella sp.]PJE05946.1 MAG: hypothetical protein CK430_15180 [Legionella sp.]
MKKILTFILLITLNHVAIAKSELKADSTHEVTRLFYEHTDFSQKKNRKLLAEALIKNLIKLNGLSPVIHLRMSNGCRKK